ncbi:MAG: leucine-rich repeat domain-containing protein [Treponema sp.]|nr:leucine-rich repeat domain-containing protein [Treponema sp.]
MENVLKIENGILIKCDENAENVEIPNGVTEIANYAFESCDRISKVEFAGTTEQWKNIKGKLNLFKEVRATKVKCSDGVVERPTLLIEDNVILWCFDTSPTVKIPENVTEIACGAFSEARSGMRSVLGNFDFWGDTLVELPPPLSYVEFEGTLEQWKSVKGKKYFWEYVHATEVKCSDGIDKKAVLLIEDNIVQKCLDDKVVSIEIPIGVTEIGELAFRDCKSLASVVIPNSVSKIDDDAFYDCTSLSVLKIPESVIEIGKDVFRKCSSLTSVDIPNSVEKIGDNAFEDCVNLSSVIISDRVIEIGEKAFRNCNITELNVDGLKITNGIAFKDKTVLYFTSPVKDVIIPDGMTVIDRAAFAGCDSVKSVTIPSSVKLVDYFAFSCSDSLTIVFHGSVKQWKSIADSEWNGFYNVKVKCIDGEIS